MNSHSSAGHGVTRAGEEPEFLRAAPLSPEITLEVFGTERPTRADYDRAAEVMWDVIEERSSGGGLRGPSAGSDGQSAVGELIAGSCPASSRK